MDITARVLIITLLVDEFNKLAMALDPCDHDFPEILKKAKLIQAKAERFYIKWDNSPELLERIQSMDSIIKKLEQKQNNHVTDM